jgi:hypothetical protein
LSSAYALDAAAGAAKVNKQWVIVPVTATADQVNASLKLDLSYMPMQAGADRVGVYAAMLAARPTDHGLELVDSKELAELRKDAARLDALGNLCEGYGSADCHEGNRWMIDGPYSCVRDALDSLIDVELAKLEATK